ncbi:MFS transporter [Jeongeupia naejangsanensis]|uniref:MFS transporter n=1 Tax=Jeongeupia naejangsanensis TaxID=613195 RepID=A0ABS2BNF6_9NEIS|nr:MFS transporter [Jeongeupia naejangsanensis]MBM3116329.1 MFS transporter [Jeongeupia naejangsanensis]
MNTPPLLSRHPELGRARVYLFGLTAGCVTGVDFVASSMIGIAGAHIQGGVNAAPEEYLWAITVYAAAAVVANLVLGRIGSRITFRRYILLSLLVFCTGALLCAASNDISELVLARAVQGLGGGGLFAAARIIAQLVSEPHERLPIFVGFGLGSFAMTALAPWVSAELALNLGWRAIFLVQALVAVPLFAMVLTLFPRRREPPTTAQMGTLGWPAALAFGFGALLLLHGVEDFRLARIGLSGGETFALLAGAGLLVFAFRWLHSHPDPWLDIRRLGSRRYLVGLGFYSLYYLISGGWNYLVPSFMQAGLGFNFQTTGMVLSLAGIVGLVGVMLHTFNFRRIFRRRRVITAGFIVFALAATLLSVGAMPGASIATLMPAMMLQSLTTALIMVQVASMTYLDFEPEDFVHAYQLKNIMREVATALGTGMTSQWLQTDRAIARTDLVGRVNVFDLQTLAPELPRTPDTLARLSLQIDQQAALIACDHLFVALAVICIAAAGVVLAQRALA